MCQGSLSPSLFSSAKRTCLLIAGLNLKSASGSPDFRTIGVIGALIGKLELITNDKINIAVPMIIFGIQLDLLINDCSQYMEVKIVINVKQKINESKSFLNRYQKVKQRNWKDSMKIKLIIKDMEYQGKTSF